MSIFKKKGGQVNAANVHMTEAEAALAQSDFNIEKITDIQNKFTGGAILLVPGRIFIREGLLFKVCRKGLKKRQFFLFNDILVYGSFVAGRYSNQQILPLSQMSVSSDCFYQPRVDADFISETDEEDLDVANAFQISHANKSFHVFGQSAADKANWIANLQKHISRVAKTITDSQQQVLTRPVWVPDSMSKECMICSTKFTAFLRKHHCRRCGRVICSSCSPHRVSLGSMEGGGASGSGEGQGKPERTCRECFKEMTAVHNRVNSVNKSKTKLDTTDSNPPRPPPPAVAAKIVSNALKSVTTPTKEEVKALGSDQVDSSTDTEDSDDSGNEEGDKPPSVPVPAKRSSTTSPIPAKRSSTTKPELERPTPMARQSCIGEATLPSTPPVPLARRSLKASTPETSPTLKEKASNQNLAAADEDEPQPTPPPRKKKIKKKLEEQQAPVKAEEERELPEGTDEDPGQPDSPSNKKARRRNKYSRPQEDGKPSESKPDIAAEEGEPRDGVEGEPRDGVEGEPRDGVEGEPRDGVEGGAGEGVKGEPCDGVEGEPRDGVEGGAGDGVEGGAGEGVGVESHKVVKGETSNGLEMDTSGKLENEIEGGDGSEVCDGGGAGEGGDDVKSEQNGGQSESVNGETIIEEYIENGDNTVKDSSPGSAKRGRRRQKFKPSAPQN